MPQVVAGFVEPPLFVLAARRPPGAARRRLVVIALLAMAGALGAAGLVQGPWAMAAVMCLAWTAGGLGLGLAEATLMEASPGRQELLMARWTLLGVLGDLAGPLALSGLAALGWGWRAAFWLAGGLVAIYALVIAGQRFPEAAGEGEEDNEENNEMPLRQALAAAVGNRDLLTWLLGERLCDLLDELFVAFGGLYMGRHLGMSVAERGWALAAMMVGGALGLAITERLLARGAAPLRLLRRAGITCALTFLAWLAAPTPLWSGAALFVLGLFTAPQWPITSARAYRALPGQGAMVNAVGGLFTPLSVAWPLLLGAAADRLGLEAALLLLLLQPLGLALLAARRR